jgi:hypothetical protein
MTLTLERRYFLTASQDDIYILKGAWFRVSVVAAPL